MPRHQRRTNDSGLTAIMIEGGLISPAQLALIAATPPDLKTAADYNCPKGTNLRDEITRYFRIAQAHWQAFARIDDPNALQTANFAKAIMEGGFGFEGLTGPHLHSHDDHTYRIAWDAKGGRVPMVVAAPMSNADAFNKSLPELGDEGDGTIHRRSPVVLLQDWLNTNADALWGMCFAGDRVRLMRDNASLTRQSYIEADLGAIFRDEIFSDFTALWLLIHATRFGGEGTPTNECALERWREAGMQAGTTARQRLGVNVEEALLALGQGLLDVNPILRTRLDDNSLEMKALFEQILRIVYRLIFLAVAEDRDLLHPRNTVAALRNLYKDAYGFDALRERAGRRSSHDHHSDAWEGMLVTFKALESGESRLGLPALGGLFSTGLTPDLNNAHLPNKAFLKAIFRLSFLIDKGQRVRINWRDMATEELGSVYEGLLELVPVRENHGRTFAFAGGAEQKGNARKTSGSYYTPDSLVQALLDSALDPVLDRAEAESGADGILKLTVIDPACGSGHFLLGAARRMATRVAQARNPDAPDYNAAMRDVVRNTIYGVDRNPMAVELTKVALWIETVEPGKPLGFLDANIRCGDSLLGVFDLSVLEKGIPDAAYKALSGDEKEACKVLMKVNRNQRDEKWADLSGYFAPAIVATAARRLHDMAEDSPAHLKAKAEAFAALRNGKDWWSRKLACDLYVAAFLRPKHFRETAGYQSKAPDLVPTTHDVKTAVSGGQGNPQLTDLAVELASAASAFHWPLEFPDIFATGGFDVVIGNPPWEVVQLSEEEYFASRDADIGAMAGAARKSAIAQLQESNLALFIEFERDKRASEVFNEFVRASGRFDLTARGKTNTYALFAEHFAHLTNSGGRSGVIVPTGIATDATTAPFFGSLVESQRLASLFDFENRDGLFEGVHRSYKFCLLTLGHKVSLAEFAFFMSDTTHLLEAERRFTLTPQQIAKINPNTKTAPVFRSRHDAELTAKIYDRVPVLIDDAQGPKGNLWGVEFRQGLFNMTSDSGLFRTAVQLSSEGFTQAGPDWTKDAVRYVPLYEAKMIQFFDHRFGDYRVRGGERGNRVMPETPLADYQNPDFEPLPFYYVQSAALDAAARSFASAKWFVAFKDVTAATNERTAIFSFIPYVGVGHTSPLLFSSLSPKLTCCLVANLNSLCMDFCARSKVGGLHLTYMYLKQFPIFSPETYTDVDILFVVSRVLELTYTSHSMAPFAHDLGYDGPPFGWDEDRRATLRAELDSFFAKKYGLSRDELRYILDPADVLGDDYPSETFRVLKNKEIREFGEFRTQRLVLEAWDRISISATTALPATIELDAATLPDDAWVRPATGNNVAATLAQLAALIKAMPSPLPASKIRLAALYALEPRYLTRQLDGADRSTWLRLVGQDAQDVQGTNILAFASRINVAWRDAVTQLVGMGAIVEDAATQTWAAGAGVYQFHTSSWPDGRAKFVLHALESMAFDEATTVLAVEDQQWVRANAA